MTNLEEQAFSAGGQIAIQPLGLDDSELRLLKSLCTISSIAKGSRNRKYALVAPGESSQIYVLDARKAESYLNWKIANDAEDVPVLLIADADYESNGSNKVVHRPIIPSRFLAMLDSLLVIDRAAA